MKHTKGPWSVDTDTGLDVIATHKDAELYYIVDVVADYDKTNIEGVKQRKANARLIAAAPEMLEALEYTIQAFVALGQTDKPGTHLRSLKELVNKAKGVK